MQTMQANGQALRMALDLALLSRLYLGGPKTYPAAVTALARLCCTRHDLSVANNFTNGFAAATEIDAYYTEAAKLGFEGTAIMWRRYAIGTRERV